MAKEKPAREAKDRTPKEAKSPRQSGGRPAKGGLVLSGVPRVNLLPASELERRATVSLGKRWLVGLLATGLAVTSVVAGANWVRATAIVDLVAEQDRTVGLNTELAGFAAVSRTLAEQAELTSYRGSAMGSDIEWRAFFKTLVAAVPAGSELRSLELVAGANPAEGADPTTSIGLIGRATLATDEPQDLARMVKNLRQLEVTLAADAGSLSSAGEDGYTFTVDFVINQAPYSGRFIEEEGAR